ncbi:putative undecaprenyl diphosphate synthase-domain-containing protein [Phakopsora pachyrhizi]|uniref:Alkyl transferase n=1 Tax=Phakopsora pachyrhizi TaxID=170000 RepID=A0AAV0AGL8_PHAPC|nr:putative undecaprenyl diphosphate synthase-domain-containing protein [Phakopsora pachyrhizi]CAH7666688.1 putative undecaprenyl diphosphate synthase-domain-containing protein [Phakopsora pachyrhizi]
MQTILSILPKLIPRRFYPTLRTLLILTLRQGPLPSHVGFIMDGNRRFSRSAGLSIEQGHLAGFEALKRVLELLLRLEIPNVTVYAFAIENFNRSPEEVTKLMNLARVKLLEICEKGQLLDQYGIRVVVIGRKDLLPPDVQASVNKVETMTAQNKRGCLNVAFPYSSQEEMATSMYQALKESMINRTPSSQIDIETLNKHVYTSHCPPLDIVIRTSGVHRLSDFLLWQTSRSIESSDKIQTNRTPDVQRKESEGKTEVDDDYDGLHHHEEPRGRRTTLKFFKDLGPSVHFVPRFWPDFGILDVLPILLGWQAEMIFHKIF